MARSFILLIVIAAGAVSVLAQTPESAAIPSRSPDLKKYIDRPIPEEKERFSEKIEKWKSLPPEEREALMLHEKMRREKMQHEIEETLKNSGLQLDKDRQEVFTLRYTQERRKIEEQLRKELEEKRRPLLKEMIERLVIEFSPTPIPTR